MDNLQQMVDTIEFTQIEVKVVEGLKQGNEALEQLHKVLRERDRRIWRVNSPMLVEGTIILTQHYYILF